MGTVCRIGLDIAKNIFQVHGVDMHGNQVFKKKLKRDNVLPFFANLPSCLIGLEACGGAHFWARELKKLDAGHDVRLIPPRLVKPFVINNKNDVADAKAICEVVGRPSTLFVNVKTVKQQNVASLHKIRDLQVKERTALVNQIRALLYEQGITILKGRGYVRLQLPFIISDQDNDLDVEARDYLTLLHEKLVFFDDMLARIESRIKAFAKNDEACKRIQDIKGVGYLTSTAIVAHAGNARHFKNGRGFAACLGITPREYSSGGKQKLYGISKRGNGYIRRLLIQGARVVVRLCMQKPPNHADPRIRWVQGVVKRRNKHVAAVALANKNARIIWALLARGEEYNPEYNQEVA